MVKTALITGITGQDGSYLAEFLLEKGYEVHGLLRRSSSFNTGRIEHLYLDEWVRDMHHKPLITMHYADMTDSSSLIRVIQTIQPDEIYNLAAQSHVKVSFDVPEYTAETDAVGTLRLLEAVRILGLEKKTKIYQGSTSNCSVGTGYRRKKIHRKNLPIWCETRSDHKNYRVVWHVRGKRHPLLTRTKVNGEETF